MKTRNEIQLRINCLEEILEIYLPPDTALSESMVISTKAKIKELEWVLRESSKGMVTSER